MTRFGQLTLLFCMTLSAGACSTSLSPGQSMPGCSMFQQSYECVDNQMIAELEAQKQEVQTRLAAQPSLDRGQPRAFAAELSKAAWRTYYDRAQLFYDRGLNDYANEVLARLMAHLPPGIEDPGIVVQIGAADNAFALPEKVVVIPVKFFANYDDPEVAKHYVDAGEPPKFSGEDEFAALIAHEAAHILFDHVGRFDDRQRQNRITQAIQAASVVGSVAATLEASRSSGGEFSLETNATEEQLQRRVNYAQAATYGFQQVLRVINASYQRYEEDIADMLAVDLLHKAGYGPGAIGALLDMYQQENKSLERRLLSARENLSPEDRQFVNTSLYAMGVDPNSLGGRLLSEVTGAVLGALRDNAMKAHPDVEDRIENVLGYALKHGVVENEIQFSPGAFYRDDGEAIKSVANRGNTAEALRRYTYALTANTLLTSGDLEAADRLSALAVSGRFGNEPYLRTVRAEVRTMQAQKAAGLLAANESLAARLNAQASQLGTGQAGVSAGSSAFSLPIPGFGNRNDQPAADPDELRAQAREKREEAAAQRRAALDFYRKALQNYEFIINAGYNSPAAFENSARLLLVLGDDIRRAERMVERGEQALGSNEPFLPIRAEIARRRDAGRDEKPNLVAALQACEATENPAIIEQCKNSAREFRLPGMASSSSTAI